MKMEVHTANGIEIAEIISNEIIIHSSEDGTDLMGNLYCQGYYRIAIHKKNLTPNFFDLKNGIAGEVLQKFSNYRVRLAIIGNFSEFTSKSLMDFIYESNNGNHINFVSSIEEAIDKLST